MVDNIFAWVETEGTYVDIDLQAERNADYAFLNDDNHFMRIRPLRLPLKRARRWIYRQMRGRDPTMTIFPS